MNVAVVGASHKPDRMSYKAVEWLRNAGHAVYPVHPVIKEIQGIKVFKSANGIDTMDACTLVLLSTGQFE
jgi:predicted CoA-binding protein